MIKFFGKNNDLRTEEGIITKTGYLRQGVFIFRKHKKQFNGHKKMLFLKAVYGIYLVL